MAGLRSGFRALLGRLPHAAANGSTEISCRDCRAVASASLADQGWIISYQLEPMFELHADFRATQADNVMLVKISGHDRRLHMVQVNDLALAAVGRGIHLIFVHGDFLDPRVKVEIENKNSIFLRPEQLGGLMARLESRQPSLTGSIDLIDKAGLIKGWVKVTPAKDPAVVHILQGDELIGEAIANEFRKDLTKVGSGRFAFSVPIKPIESMGEFGDKLKVRVYSDDRYVGLIRMWSGTQLIE